jgi:hypothetical protein
VAKKSNKQNPFLGLWRIVSMDQFEQDYVNAEDQAFIEFDESGGGELHFGYVQGDMDCRLTTRDGEPAIEWSWEGNDEMDPSTGRGWALLKADELHGIVFFHQGDESGFVAKRVGAKKRPKGK